VSCTDGGELYGWGNLYGWG